MSSISTWTKREIVWESVRRNAHYKRDYAAFRRRFDPWFAEKGIRKGIDPWVSTVFDAQFFKQLSAEHDIKIFFELLRWLRAFRIQWLFAGPPLDPRMDRSEFPNSEYPRLILTLILPHPDPEENETGFVKDPFEPLPIEELVRQIRQHERESRKSRSIFLKNGIRRIEKHLRTQ